MSELRKDPIVDRWVIIATERGKRPSDFGTAKSERKSGFCPFCYGNEDKTPPEIRVIREPGTAPNTPGWRVRVVANKFPALQVEGGLSRTGEGIYDKMNGIGAHEVIIDSPEHNEDIPNFDLKRIEEVLGVYAERIADLKKDLRLRYVMIFRNRGEAAGASLEHPHSQLISTPVIPKRVTEEIDGAKRHYDLKERCVFCDIVRQELGSGDRVVEENERFVSLTPFASRFPFETWVVPKSHSSNYEFIGRGEVSHLAAILKSAIVRLNGALNNPPYNYLLHTSPCNQADLPYYHWHIEIIPHLTKVAGFEWGSGFYINPTPPEEAAKYLRETNPHSSPQ
jgi:UDPglucose--hexose-1-phosphate uridylyltransferase